MFNARMKYAASLVISLAALTACDSEPLAPLAQAPQRAATITTTGSGNIIYRDAATVPFSFVVFTSCANGGLGEVLQVGGQLQYTGHWITTTQGERQHNMMIASFSGSATGWDTGEIYDVVTHELAQSNDDYGSDGILDSGEELQRVQLRLTSRTTGAVIDVVLVGRFVQTATGEYVLDGWDGTSRCN